MTRQGVIVYLEGCMKPTKNVTLTYEGTQAFTVPEGFRPAHTAFAICQGSGMNRWFLTVYRDGRGMAARYGAGAYEEAPTGTYMPFSMCYSTV